MTMDSDWRASLLAQFAQKRGAQREFAKKVRCSEPHLSLVLREGRAVSYPLAKRISEQTGFSVDDVMAPPIAPGEAAE